MIGYIVDLQDLLSLTPKYWNRFALHLFNLYTLICLTGRGSPLIADPPDETPPIYDPPLYTPKLLKQTSNVYIVLDLRCQKNPFWSINAS